MKNMIFYVEYVLEEKLKKISKTPWKLSKKLGKKIFWRKVYMVKTWFFNDVNVFFETLSFWLNTYSLTIQIIEWR